MADPQAATAARDLSYALQDQGVTTFAGPLGADLVILHLTLAQARALTAALGGHRWSSPPTEVTDARSS